jgi:hypothetical protein
MTYEIGIYYFSAKCTVLRAIISSEITGPIGTKLCRNDIYKHLLF